MPLAIAYSRGSSGVHAPLITVEVHLSNGLPALNIVGLAEAAVKESKDRVRSAIINSGFEFPNQRITINLAPADLPKEGGRFDLAIALGILAASQQIFSSTLTEYECVGELSLGGELRAVKGILPVVIASRNAGRKLLFPHASTTEASLIEHPGLFAAHHLLDVCEHLSGKQCIPATHANYQSSCSSFDIDFADVQGQYQAKRALEIAAAGGHNVLMIGPPGTGKSMLAARLATILPPLNALQAQESAVIASISQQNLKPRNWSQPPFRNPHHTASAIAMVGGGSHPKPGEISLAHNGTLFLDELPEFDRKVLEVLREPLETGVIHISRAQHQTEFPARFQLIAAMNPCPCGYWGDPSGRCRCTSEQIARYRQKISGPLLDRIDMHLEVSRQTIAGIQLLPKPAESSEIIRQRVIAARQIAFSRQGKSNSWMTPVEVAHYCKLDDPCQRLLHQAQQKLGLSHRAYHRILKVARSIADLNASNLISTAHLSEAISFRRLDRHN